MEDFDRGLSAFRQPPHNVEAEKAVLGAIFANNRAYDAVCEFLRPEHFALAQNGLIFAACAKAIVQGGVADPVTMKHAFEADRSLADIGGVQYLAELAASAVGLINAGEYGRLIVDLFRKRRLIEAGEALVDEAFGSDDDAEAIQERAEARLLRLVDGGARTGAQPASAYVEPALRHAEAAYKRGAPVGLQTGLVDLDGMLGGLHNTDLIILAGRPSMGKSALGSTIGFNVAEAQMALPHPLPALIYTLEMSGEQLVIREMAARAGYSSHLVRMGRIGQDQFMALQRTGELVSSLPLWIDERPSLPIQMIRASARRFKRQHGLCLVIVDYLQLSADDERQRRDGRVQEVSEITRGLKGVAKELDVPVLALSQLSRAVEARDNKRPQLSDLRESGSIEQDADVVMFIFREEYYLERDEPVMRESETAASDSWLKRRAIWEQKLVDVRSIAEVIVAKQRHGPIGTVRLRFDKSTTRFSNLGML